MWSREQAGGFPKSLLCLIVISMCLHTDRVTFKQSHQHILLQRYCTKYIQNLIPCLQPPSEQSYLSGLDRNRHFERESTLLLNGAFLVSMLSGQGSPYVAQGRGERILQGKQNSKHHVLRWLYGHALLNMYIKIYILI